MNLYTSTLIRNIFQNCDNFWDQVLIEDIYWNRITWNEYKNKAINYALFLNNRWINKQDTIVIFVKDVTKFSYIVLSSLLVWARVVIVEAEYSEKILEEKLKFIKPDFLVIEKGLYILLKTPILNRLKKIKKYISLLRHSKNIIVNNNNEKVYNLDGINFLNNDKESEALIVFTWWTTSSPKWVVHTLESIEVMIERITNIIWNNTNIFYADLPHFVLIWIVMWVKVVVWENDLSQFNFIHIIEKYEIDTTFSPPYRYIDIVNLDYKIPSCLTNICLWSAPIYRSFLEKLSQKIDHDTKLTCIYGMTELLPVAYVDWREKIKRKIDWDLLWKPFNDININVLESWELELSWRGLFKRYLWWIDIKKHKTWDLVDLIDWDLVMKWRKKDMILRRDYNIYPSLYEPIINSIDWIITSALVWIWDIDLEDEKVILFIEWDYLDKMKIFNYLSKWEYSIDAFAQPDEICFCKIPRIWRQNKIDKQFLRNNYKYIWR